MMIPTFALLLALAGDSLPGPRHTNLPGPRFGPDSWTHDVGHLVSMTIGTPAFSLWLKELGVSRSRSRWVTVGTMLAVVVLKEVQDERVASGFSTRDLITGAAGIGVGMIISERVWRTSSARAH